MNKSRKAVDVLINAHLDQLFAGVKPTQQQFDFREELATNIRDKVADHQARGLDADQAWVT